MQTVHASGWIGRGVHERRPRRAKPFNCSRRSTLPRCKPGADAFRRDLEIPGGILGAELFDIAEQDDGAIGFRQ